MKTNCITNAIFASNVPNIQNMLILLTKKNELVMTEAMIQIIDEYSNDFVVNLTVGCFLVLSSLIKSREVMMVAVIDEIQPGIHSIGDSVTRSEECDEAMIKLVLLVCDQSDSDIKIKNVVAINS